MSDFASCEGPKPPPDLGGVVPCCAQAASSVTVTDISKRPNIGAS
jgi:hypothetical protein